MIIQYVVHDLRSYFKCVLVNHFWHTEGKRLFIQIARQLQALAASLGLHRPNYRDVHKSIPKFFRIDQVS